MSKRKIFLSFLVLLLLTVLLAVFIFWLEKYEKTTTVTFLAVGEGDAILISQGQNQILIDGGRSGKELLARMGRHMPFWDRRVEIVIATHPDADHIGGFVGLLGAYRVGQFLYTGAQSKTETFTLLQKALTESNLEPQKIFRGSSIKLPRGGELAIEYPLSALPKDVAETNTGSIVSRLTYGVTQILFTGDLPDEETVLPEIQTADILKVAHHGSRYSTSSPFLDWLQPSEAIISVGKNTYGHPSPDVLQRLREHDAVIRRTDTEGDISYRCTKELSRCVYVY
ncbi:MAG: MBL fold metallo-hydrolase [Candidatus Moranbacteria bacterium]|nr:MBL fold metallo-hydrolase [Candidatus Moranbacteria bacterium]